MVAVVGEHMQIRVEGGVAAVEHILGISLGREADELVAGGVAPLWDPGGGKAVDASGADAGADASGVPDVLA